MRHVTAVSGKEPFHVRLSTSRHIWAADEPPENGGEDIGPSPFELLAGAVGSCVVITAQMYADRKKWPLKSVQVEVDHERVKAEDCEDCDSSSGKISEFKLRVTLSGDELSEEQRQRIFEIAGRCPVKRALESEIKFRSRLES